MPSPFPGMDPYLESPAYFGDLHDGLIHVIKSMLQRELPAAYYAAASDRLWVEVSERPIEPDLNVPRRSGTEGQRPRPASAAAVAGPTLADEPLIVTVPHDEHRESFLDILTRGPDGEIIVATVEILSPSNKRRRSKGRRLYLKKQREVLRSRTHLVEIDLLRSGEHTTAVPRARLEARSGPYDYHVCVHRSDRPEQFAVYPIRVRERLPRVRIPLLPGDGEAVVDLQAAFDRSYDDGPFVKRVRYRDSVPEPPLSPADAAWAAERVAAAAEMR